MERDTGIKYEPGVKYKCVNSEVGGLCGQTIDCVRKQMMVSVPHRHIGAVICVGPGGSVQYGSGTLISKNLVLTCAHVIFNWQHRAYYNQIIFYPALSGEMKIWHLVQNFEAPEQYGENNMDQSKQYDYALLKLKEPVKQEEQFLELSEDPSVITEDDILSIYGYPVSRYDTENGKPFAAKQYGLKRQAYILDFALEEGYIIHRISTESGQSGSPVIKTNESGKMTIIGIHIGSTAEDIQKYQDIYSDLNKVNLTKVLNKMIVKNLKSFADKLNGQTFKVQNEEKNTSSLVENKMSLQRRQKLPREKYFPKKIEQKTAEQYFIEATCHHKAKRYEDAVECFRTSIRIDPSYGGTYYNLGISLFYMGKFEEAIEAYCTAIKIDPNNVDAYFNLGITFKKINNTQEAIKWYRKVIQIDPNYAKAHLNLGCALFDIGKFEEAMQSYQKTAQLNQNIQSACDNMVTILMRKEYTTQLQIQKSLIFLEDIIAKYPGNFKAEIAVIALKAEKLKLNK